MASPKSATRIPYDPTRHRLTRSGRWQDATTLRFAALDPATIPAELAAPRGALELPRPLAEGPGRDLGPAPLPPSAPPAPVPSAPGPEAPRPLEAPAPAAPVGAFDALPDASAGVPSAPMVASAGPGLPGLAPAGAHVHGCWRAAGEGTPCACGETVFPRPEPAAVQSAVGLYEHALNAVAERRGGRAKPFAPEERAAVTELFCDLGQRYGMHGGKHAPAFVLAFTTWALLADRSVPAALAPMGPE